MVPEDRKVLDLGGGFEVKIAARGQTSIDPAIFE
jgi:hypothetical protein